MFEFFLMNVLLLLVIWLRIQQAAAQKLSKCAPQIYFIYFRCYSYATFQKVCTFRLSSGISFWPMGQNIWLYIHKHIYTEDCLYPHLSGPL